MMTKKYYCFNWMGNNDFNKSQGILSPPCSKSLEYLLELVTSQLIEPPRQRNKEHNMEILGRCPTISLFLVIETAYLSIAFLLSSVLASF